MSAGAIGRRRRLVLATLALGVLVMVAFDHWFTLLAGIALMLGSVVAGVFLVAVPGGFLDHDAADPQDAEAGPQHAAAGPQDDATPRLTGDAEPGHRPGG